MKKKRVDCSGLVTKITFLCACAQRIPPKFRTLRRFYRYIASQNKKFRAVDSRGS